MKIHIFSQVYQWLRSVFKVSVLWKSNKRYHHIWTPPGLCPDKPRGERKFQSFWQRHGPTWKGSRCDVNLDHQLGALSKAVAPKKIGHFPMFSRYRKWENCPNGVFPGKNRCHSTKATTIPTRAKKKTKNDKEHECYSSSLSWPSNVCLKKKLRGWFKYLLYISSLLREMIQLDEHLFQMGWNHPTRNH